MVLRSKSVGEQDVADQQGAFLCREDFTFVEFSFLVGEYVFSLCFDFEDLIFDVLDFYTDFWSISYFISILVINKITC